MTRPCTQNENPNRTPEEVAALEAVANEKPTSEPARKARVILLMNNAHKDDGSYLSFKDRMEKTMSTEGVSQNYVRKCLRLFNRAGINGIMRVNAELKPDIQDRKEDKVPEATQEPEKVPGMMKGMDNFDEKALQKVAELSGIDAEIAKKVKEAYEQLGIQFVPTNPALFQHVTEKDKKHAEIGGFYIGYKFGVLAIAIKNCNITDSEKPFILREVFKETESCQETGAAIKQLFAETSNGPVLAEGSAKTTHRNLDVFFSNLEKTYPQTQGWALHCYVYDAEAMTDSDTEEPIIDCLPVLEGCSYEKTVHLCDFTSPFKAAFQLAYSRDCTNIQGWKVRDRVNSLFDKSTKFMTPIMYIGANAEIIDPSKTTIEMTAKVSLPDGSVFLVNTGRQTIPSMEELGTDAEAVFQNAASTLDYLVTDIAKELAGNTFQSILSNAQSKYATEGEQLRPILIEAESGRRTIWVQAPLAKVYGQKDMMYTNNLLDMIGEIVNDDSYRETVNKLNRSLHRKSFDELHYTTLQDKIAREGIKIQECLEEECQKGLEMYEVVFEDGKLVSHRIPESAVHPFDKDKAVPVYDWKQIEKNLNWRNKHRSEDAQITIEQVKELLSKMEFDPMNTVYVMFDGVIVKKQKEERKQEKKMKQEAQQKTEGENAEQDKPEQPPKKRRGRPKKEEALKKKAEESQAQETQEKKKRLETYNVYILYRNKAYVLMGVTMEDACKNALGYLLRTGLLEGNDLVFFSDGATTIKETIKRYFCFREYHLFLDYYHVEQKIYQYFTMFLKGGKERLEENKKLREEFFALLWQGNIEACKEFINNIDPKSVKCPSIKQSIIGYLEKKEENLYCFEVRKIAGLINSSNRVEQTNNELESRRQKKNGMAWTPTGSRSLAAFAMVYKNRIQVIWYQKGEVSFEMFNTKVPPIYRQKAS